jgi:hypothetical protein
MYLTPAQLETYTSTIRKTHQWAVNNTPKLLAEKDLQAHYKASYFWNAVGDPQHAGLWRKLIAEQFLQPDGDFRTSPDTKGFLAFPATLTNQYIYSNGWIIAGMIKWGAYDIAHKGLQFMLRFQDPNTGGCYYSFDPGTGAIDKRLLDSSSTSAAGLAFLSCGRLAEARKAGDFLLRLLDIQPHPNEFFFSCMTPDGTLHTDVMKSENQWDEGSRKQKCLSARSDALNELTWLIGKPNKFLTRLYTATGESKYLEGAKTCFEFFHKLDERAWTNYASCKTMWSGAELYRITGDRRYADTATRLLDFYCKTQSPTGTWVHTLWYKSEAEQSFPWTADITCEYGAEFTDVLYDLSAR